MPLPHTGSTAVLDEALLPAAPPAPHAQPPSPSTARPSHIVALLLILGAATFLRFHNLAARGLWMDEGVSAAITRLSWDNFTTLLEWREGNMSLYYLLLRGWAQLGFSEFHLRSLSVLFGSLTVLAVYYLGKELYGRAAGLVAALILALHPFHIHYSQEARSYALLGLTLVLATYFMLRALRTGSQAHFMGFVVSGALSVYAHFFAVLCLPPLLCAALVFPERKAEPRKLVSAAALLVLLAFPGMQYAWRHQNIGLIDWIPAPSWDLLARCAAALLGVPGLLGLAYFAAILALLLVSKAPAESQSRASLRWTALPGLWSLVPGLVLLAASFHKPILIDRYLLMCVPGVALLGAYAFHGLSRAWRTVFACVVVLVAALSIPASYRAFAADSQDWKGAVGYAIQHAQPDDVVLLDNGIVRPIFEYYRWQFQASAPRVNSFGPRSERLNYADFAGITPPAVVGRMARIRDRVWIFEWGPPNPLVPEMDRHFRKELSREYAHVKVTLYVCGSSAGMSP